MPAPESVSYIWDCDGCTELPSNVNPDKTGGPFDISWSTPGVKTIRLTAISKAPCIPETTATQTVTVNLPPSPQNITLNCGAANTPICANTFLSITVEAQGQGYSYIWYQDGSRLSASTPTVSLRWNTPGTKTVTVEVRAIGCNKEDQAVTLNCNPIVVSAPSTAITSTPLDINNNRRFCTTDELKLEVPEGEGQTYSWQLNGVETSTTRYFGPRTLPPGIYTLNVTVINPNLPAECQQSRLATPIRFTVSAPPAIDVSNLPQKLCQG
ncbi:MAG: PapG chaperone-binding domain-containing protein, partial [Bacteroidia bacterium]|nr:hypothetical protein [Bacteroidia bacterium]MDW8158371.1 PapG chaperone-binding domain-containing protein [Bacteroidia bacterium]